MKLMTCNGCQHAGGCERASDFRSKVRGLGIRSVKFACPDRAFLFQPGDPVWFQSWVTEGDERHPVKWAGWVIQQRSTRIYGFIPLGSRDDLCEIPFEGKANGFVNFPLSRVSLDLTRERRTPSYCRTCGSEFGITQRCEQDPQVALWNICPNAEGRSNA